MGPDSVGWGTSGGRVVSEVNREWVHVPRAEVSWLKRRINLRGAILQCGEHDLPHDTLLIELDRSANRLYRKIRTRFCNFCYERTKESLC